MALRKRDDDLVFPNAAGTDVGCSSHWVAVLKHRCGDPVLEFGVMTDDLNAMADWLFAMIDLKQYVRHHPLDSPAC